MAVPVAKLWRTIMAGDGSILISQQEFLRRACDTGHGGVPAKVLASRAGLSESTLRSYGRSDAPAMMSLAALWKLCGAAEPELLNLLLPDGFAIVRLPEHGELPRALNALAAGSARFAAEAIEALSDGRLSPDEAAALVRHAGELVPALQAIAAGGAR